METPQHSVKPCAKSREAERKRRYREMKKSSATNEELVENRKKNAEQQQRFRESMANCSDKEKVEQHKRKRAESQRNYKKAKKQCTGKMYIAWQSLDEFCENSVECEDEGRMPYICSACGALMFKGEQSKGSVAQKGTFSFCCSHGDVKIPPVKEPPSLLKDFLTGGTQRDCNFRKNIRAYNSSLAFASMLLTGEEYNFKSQKGPYCYRINGQVYH